MPVEEEERAQQIWAVLGQAQPQLEKQLVPPFPQGGLSPMWSLVSHPVCLALQCRT